MQLSIYLCSFSSTCFGLIRPSSGAMDVTISLHSSATRHQHTHSSGPTPNYTICCICKEIVTSIAPEDGRISPKHVELKEHKWILNCIKLVNHFIFRIRSMSMEMFKIVVPGNQSISHLYMQHGIAVFETTQICRCTKPLRSQLCCESTVLWLMLFSSV